jgi:hypothetical protein
MQEINLAEFDPADDGPSRLSRIRRTVSTAIGACIALALLVAMGMWFYRLGVRDAENVPIIRAAAAPAKIRPEDPGGAVAPYQDVASYRVAESKPAQATAVVIAPPPPEPRREDVAMGKLPPEPRREDGPTAGTTAPVALPQAAPSSASPASGEAAPPVIPVAATPALTASPDESEPAAEVAAQPEASEIDELVALAHAAETAEPAMAVPPADPVPRGSDYAPPLSPVALPRPPDLKARMAAAVQAAEQSADDLVRRAAESEVQIQLAADPSEDAVRRMWQRISQANQDILHDRELSVQTTVSGGTKFYRLRVGPFGDVSEARALCQALKARGQDCIVARNG